MWLFRVLLFALVFTVTAAAAAVAPVYDISEATPLNYAANASQAGTTPAGAASMSLTIVQRIEKLENQLANMQQENFLQHVAALQAEVQALRAQLEGLILTVNNMHNNNDVATVPQTSAPPAGAAKIKDTPAGHSLGVPHQAKLRSAVRTKTTLESPKPNKVNNKLVANQAISNEKLAASATVSETVYNFIKDQKYQQAISYLRNMLHKYPSGAFAADMHYWLGDLYGLLGKHEQASAEFLAVMKNDPHNEHCADAELKLGLIYKMQNNLTAARAMFNKVISNHPNTNAAHLAAAQFNK